MVVQNVPMFTQLHGASDRIIYFVVFVATILVFTIWVIVLQRRNRATDVVGNAPNEESHSETPAQPRRRATRSFLIASYSLWAIGFILILVNVHNLNAHPVALYIGIAIVLIAGAIKMVTEAAYLTSKMAGKKRENQP
ncbi:MAG: hypothetical protein JWR52_2883 [Marmoricola sp.]|nr:hypothetical protein [Marmoricola sp.]